MSVIGDINVITANLSAYRTDYKGRKDHSISFSLSVPIGDNTWEGMDIQTNNGKTSPMASYTDYSDYNNLWQVRAGASQNSNASYQQNEFMALSTTLRGGFTATRQQRCITAGQRGTRPG